MTFASRTLPLPRGHAPDLAVSEQFTTPDQQRAAASLGMWLFITTEVMFFGVLFFAYAMARAHFPDAFAVASRRTDLVLGTLNTAILLTSSFAIAVAVHAAEAGGRKATLLLLLAAAALGIVFMGIKITEYVHDYQDHLVPWLGFEFASAYRTGARVFFSLYFVTTAAHLLHLLVGTGLVLGVAWAVHRRVRNALADHVGTVALYWHFVDIVWIFLYPCLYLVARS